jgi:predicted acetyltransferase
MPPQVHLVSDSEFDAWSDAVDVGFYHPANRGQADFRRKVWDDAAGAGYIHGAFDGDQVVGTLQNFETPLTVPGGGGIPTGALTTVTVAPTHRRRGILSGMMAAALAQSVDRGDAASILIPAEWPIYGRYGYGVATEQVRLRIDATQAAVSRPLPGAVELVSAEQFCAEASVVYERIRARTPGAIAKPQTRWRRETGLLTADGKPKDKEQLFALLRDEDGTPRAYASYDYEDKPFEDFRPRHLMKASLFAENAAARVRLLQYLWEHDWVVEVSADSQPVGDAYRQLLSNARVVAQAERIDVLWVRLLDVPAALSQRTYETSGRLVLAVTDPAGHAAGTYALEGGPDGATCVRTTESPDLTLPVQTLGSLYLGGFAATPLAEVGLVEEERPGAVRTADQMFRTAVPPYCATWF